MIRAMAAHTVIAGTGRAGSSFLVQFLEACGLDTATDEAVWYPRARAGGEHHLNAAGELPYVVKDPWVFAYCEELDLAATPIDALIVPMRDLMLSARSRVHQERLAVVDWWFADQSQEHQVVGLTPGGVVYSLDVVDQARILAVGFHKLLHWAVLHEIPLFLLSFPRFAEDPDYLLRVLWPWLRDHCDEARAREAFERTVDADAIRVRPPSARITGAPVEAGEPSARDVDRAVLLERIEELRGQAEHALALEEEIRLIRESPTWQLANRLGGRSWYRPLRSFVSWLSRGAAG